MIRALRKYAAYFGRSLRCEFPVGSGVYLTLDQIAEELSRRLIRLFLRDETGRRPALGEEPLFQEDPHWRDSLLFYEYFHGETGQGLGASHQTGWTALVAKLLDEIGTTQRQE
ncbi:MAG: hypothetical protein KatS3mg115_1839 [Candidatus Poribacteria bacterium]|nr:MAG: hypothetical protein KatS3mg115_1839 [Candidatus Poribacteria bacterium]